MKKLFSALTILTIAAASLITLSASKRGTLTAHAHDGCTNATLVGNYGLTFSGFLHDRGNQPFYGAGIANFDGAGNMAATFAFSLNGSPSTGNTYSATYTVNSDCTVSITAPPGSGGDSFSGVIVRDGGDVLTTDISAPDTLNMELRRQ